MDLTLDYINNSDKIKSQISAGVIGFQFKINNKYFDLTKSIDHTINIKLANRRAFLGSFQINTSNLKTHDLKQGILKLPAKSEFIQNLKPDVYFFEMWVLTNKGQYIFPSKKHALKFILMPNLISDKSEISTTEANNIKQKILSWDSLLDKDLKKYKQITDLMSDSNNLQGINNKLTELQNKINSIHLKGLTINDIKPN